MIFEIRYYNIAMTNRRNSITIQTQLTNISISLCTIDHHLALGDYSGARFEMECVMTRVTQIQSRLSNLDNIGRQPEEALNINHTTDYINSHSMNF